MSNRVRWLVVIVPALIVGVIELLSDEFLDEASDGVVIGRSMTTLFSLCVESELSSS